MSGWHTALALCCDSEYPSDALGHDNPGLLEMVPGRRGGHTGED